MTTAKLTLYKRILEISNEFKIVVYINEFKPFQENMVSNRLQRTIAIDFPVNYVMKVCIYK